MKMNRSGFMMFKLHVCMITISILLLLCACKKESNETKNENGNSTSISQLEENCSQPDSIAVEIQNRRFSVPRKSGIKIITQSKEELWDIDKQKTNLPCNKDVIKNAWGITFSATSIDKKFHVHILKQGYLLATTAEKYHQDIQKYGSSINKPQEISRGIFKYQVAPNQFYYKISNQLIPTANQESVFVSCSKNGICSTAYIDISELVLKYDFKMSGRIGASNDHTYEEGDLLSLDREVKETLKTLVNY